MAVNGKSTRRFVTHCNCWKSPTQTHTRAHAHILSKITDYRGACNHPDRNSTVWKMRETLAVCCTFELPSFSFKVFQVFEVFLLGFSIVVACCCWKQRKIYRWETNVFYLTRCTLSALSENNKQQRMKIEKGREKQSSAKVTLRVCVYVQKESFNFQLLYFVSGKKKHLLM